MGVQGLWQLIQAAGHPVTLESLEGKVLAVDVSIWLHKTMKGMRGADGNPLPNAHLLGIFKRVCKLLFYKIKPIFVFDGTAPALKKQTLTARRNKATKAELDSHKASTKILTNYLKSQLIRKALGKVVADIPMPTVTGKTDDMYALPEGVTVTAEGEDDDNDDWDDWDVQNETVTSYEAQIKNLNAVDPDSDHFRSMPSEVQHEILVDIKERRKHASWYSDEALPKDSEDFSRYQLAKMMKQSKLTLRIDEIRKEMNLNHLESNIEADFEGELLESQRLMSEDSGHYFLIKGKNKLGNSSERSLLKNDTAKPSTSGVEKVPLINLNTSEIISSNIVAKAVSNDLASKNVQKTGENLPKPIIDTFNEIDFETGKKSRTEDQTITVKLQNDPSAKRIAEMRKLTEKFFKEKTVKKKVNLSSDSEEEETKESSDMKAKMAIDEEITSNKCSSVPSEISMEQKQDQISTIERKVESTLSDSSSNSSRNELDSVEKTLAASALNTLSVSDHRKTALDKSNISETTFASQSSSMKSALSRADILSQLKSKIDKLKSDLSSEESDSLEKIMEKRPVLVGVKRKANRSPEVEIAKKTKDESNSDDSDDFVEIEENTGAKYSDESDEDVVDVTPRNMAVEVKDATMPTDAVVSPEEKKLISQFHGMTREELEAMAHNLEEEGQQLEYERKKQDRVAATLTEQIHLEAQELLRLFGVPFVVSPTEAEAQCAHLDQSNQCDGSVTDDSDIWLFGGKRVYKNFFNQDRHVELFRYEDLEHQLALDRDKMINLALLCGSDYTDGIHSVGVVSAMEILAEFPGKGVDCLRKFRIWWDAASNAKDYRPGNKIKAKLRKLELKPGFPNEAVVEAYRNPSVDESEERFTWSKPDFDLLRKFASRKFGWNMDKCDEFLLPVMKKVDETTSQKSITSYFNYIPNVPREVPSKRLQEALNKARGLPSVGPQAVVPQAVVPQSDGLPEHCGFTITAKNLGIRKGAERGGKRGGKTSRGRGKKGKQSAEEKHVGNSVESAGANVSHTKDEAIASVSVSECESTVNEEEPAASTSTGKVSFKRELCNTQKINAPKKEKTLDKMEFIEGALTKAKLCIQPHMNNRRRGRGVAGAPRVRGRRVGKKFAGSSRVVKEDVDLSESSSSSDSGENADEAKIRKRQWDQYIATFS